MFISLVLADMLDSIEKKYLEEHIVASKKVGGSSTSFNSPHQNIQSRKRIGVILSPPPHTLWNAIKHICTILRAKYLLYSENESQSNLFRSPPFVLLRGKHLPPPSPSTLSSYAHLHSASLLRPCRFDRDISNEFTFVGRKTIPIIMLQLMLRFLRHDVALWARWKQMITFTGLPSHVLEGATGPARW